MTIQDGRQKGNGTEKIVNQVDFHNFKSRIIHGTLK